MLERHFVVFLHFINIPWSAFPFGKLRNHFFWYATKNFPRALLKIGLISHLAKKLEMEHLEKSTKVSFIKVNMKGTCFNLTLGKGVSDLEPSMYFCTSREKLWKFEFVLNDLLLRKIFQPLKKFWSIYFDFSVLMAKLFGRENNFYNFFLEVQNNPYTFLNLKHL